MAARPADYFLGVHDFFALLLPGALLTFWSSPGLMDAFADTAIMDTVGSDSGWWFAIFLLVSFLLGQLLYFVASQLDGPADWLIRRFAGEGEAPRPLPFSTPKREKAHNMWAAWLRVHCPNAFPEIDRLIALSKFFRSLVVVSLLMQVGSYTRTDAGAEWEWSWEWLSPMVILFLVSSCAYVYYRMRSRHLVELYVALARGAEALPSSTEPSVTD